MSKAKIEYDSKKINSAILAEAILPNLKRKIVAVKFLKNKDDYDRYKAVELRKPINYCQMIKAASSGNIVKATEKDFLCKSGALALGLLDVDEKNSNGENWARLGLHESSKISSEVRKNSGFLAEKNYAVLIGPASSFPDNPDVYIIILEPYSAMRVVQGYTYHYGRNNNISLVGNMAICQESTANQILNKDINISMLCVGTRHKAGWKDNEMSIGIHRDKFNKTIDGIFQTINIMEDDKNKKSIVDNLKKIGIEYPIKYSYNYYMDV